MPKPINGNVDQAPFPNKPTQKGQGNKFPCGVEGQRPSWGLGQSPNLAHGAKLTPCSRMSPSGTGVNPVTFADMPTMFCH